MSLFRRVTPLSECAQWRRVLSHAVGGLTELGFSEDESLLLVVSHAGRGLFDLSTGQRLARDDEVPGPDCAWIDAAHQRVRGIGSADGEWFRVVGLWGGQLAKTDQGQWQVEVVGGGRHEQALVGLLHGKERWLVAKPISEIKAFGFSPAGRYLALGTSADIVVFAQEQASEQATERTGAQVGRVA
jgi:hypothetical protein